MRRRGEVKSQLDRVDVFTAKFAIAPGLTGTLQTSTNMDSVLSGTGPVGAASGQPAGTGYTLTLTLPLADRYPANSTLSWDASLETNPAYTHLYRLQKVSHSATDGIFKVAVVVNSGSNVANLGYPTEVIGAAAVTGTITAYFRNR